MCNNIRAEHLTQLCFIPMDQDFLDYFEDFDDQQGYGNRYCRVSDGIVVASDLYDGYQKVIKDAKERRV